MASSDYEGRRTRVIEDLSAKSAVLVVSQPEMVRNNDVLHAYRQNSDLLYLSGFEEPESAILLIASHPEVRFAMFVRPRDPAKEMWTGHRAGIEGARDLYGADVAHTIDEFPQILPKYLEDVEDLYVNLGVDPERDRLVMDLVRTGWRPGKSGIPGPVRVGDASRILHVMRQRKDEVEVENLARACEISAVAHRAAMAATRPGLREYEVQSVLEHVLARAGCPRVAYSSIVASGPNACVLHYERNSRKMEAGELLLIDAAGEYGHMAADITRTFPVSGRFTEVQRSLYEVVLGAQKAAVAQVGPGRTFASVHEVATEVLVEGMLRLGFFKGVTQDLIARQAHSRWYMHKTSHWLGMDVHDVGSYADAAGSRILEPGMVLTVEPGLYVAPDDDQAPAEYQGIGIRIEDDVLVTDAGNRVLTSGVPKEVGDIEAICGTAPLRPFAIDEGGYVR